MVDVPRGTDGRAPSNAQRATGGGDLVGLGVRRACGSRAAGDRRGRRRPPAARPRAAARRALPRPRRRSSAARRAAARRRRRGRPSPRPRRRRSRQPLAPARAPPRAARASIRSTGTSRSARSGRGRARASPSSAASVSLSARSARWSGCRRSRSTSSARPTTIPACGPPSSLSPEKQTRSAPAARLSRADGSSLRGCVTRHARAEVVDERQAVRARRPRPSSATDGCSVKPTTRKFDWCTRSNTRRLGPDRALVVGGARAVRRPDLDAAARPERASTSGMRKPSPISISSPRETSTSRPSASAASASSTAAALLLTTSAASAPVSRRRIAGDVILPRAARPGAEVVLEVRVAAPDLEPPARAPPPAAGARPEVRVHDHARWHSACAAARAPGPPSSSPSAADQVAGVIGRPLISSRARARRARAASTGQRQEARRPAVRPARARQPRADRATSSVKSRCTVHSVRSMAAGIVHPSQGHGALCVAWSCLRSSPSTSGAAARVGIGKMTVAPNRGHGRHDRATSSASPSPPTRRRSGTTARRRAARLDEAPADEPGGSGYVELQASGCVGTRIAGISRAAGLITTQCPRRHLFRLIYHQGRRPAAAPRRLRLPHADPAGSTSPKKTPFRPLGPQKQPVVRVRGAAQAGLFIRGHVGCDRRRAASALTRARGRPVRQQRGRLRGDGHAHAAATRGDAAGPVRLCPTDSRPAHVHAGSCCTPSARRP